jgi:hypothetical protein
MLIAIVELFSVPPAHQFPNRCAVWWTMELTSQSNLKLPVCARCLERRTLGRMHGLVLNCSHCPFWVFPPDYLHFVAINN